MKITHHVKVVQNNNIEVFMKKHFALLIFPLLLSSQVFASNLKDLSSGNIRPARTDKMIALTFDDGPTAKTTKAILRTLKKYNISATFFVIGQKAEDRLDILQQQVDEGHIVANHSLSHKYLGRLSRWGFKKKVKSEFFGCHDIIKDYMGNGKNLYYRAPGASWKEKAAKIINKYEIGREYIGPVLWDIGGELYKNRQGVYTTAADWACWSKGLSVESCLKGYINRTKRTNGGIVLMHDISMKTSQMLEKYIPALLKMGYTFVTLDEMDL